MNFRYSMPFCLIVVGLNATVSLSSSDRVRLICNDSVAGRSFEVRSEGRYDVVTTIYPQLKQSYNYLIEGVRNNSDGQKVIFGKMLISGAHYGKPAVIEPQKQIEIGYEPEAISSDSMTNVSITVLAADVPRVSINTMTNERKDLPRDSKFRLRSGLRCSNLSQYIEYLSSQAL